MSYFLIAISTRANLELCIGHALAGFTSSASGLWTFLDIQEGDFVSFLYGARVFNLYRVVGKAAYRHAEGLPPWPPLTLYPSGRTYSFPFRFELQPVRTLEEPLVRAEFAYVAENLLLRGGYRKTHFQADQTTLQAVSQMGRPFTGQIEALAIESADTFIPCLTADRAKVQPPEVFLFRELFLQALTRRCLSSEETLSLFLDLANVRSLDASSLEVLSEKAFPEGHVDLLLKEAAPKGTSRKVVVEVKMGAAHIRDLEQVKAYVQTLGEECVRGVLVTGSASSRVRQRAKEQGIAVLTYALSWAEDPVPFDALAESFAISE